MEHVEDETLTAAYKLFNSKFLVRVPAMALLSEYDLKVTGLIPGYVGNGLTDAMVAGERMAEWLDDGYNFRISTEDALAVRELIYEYFSDWYRLVNYRVVSRHPPLEDMAKFNNLLRLIEKDVIIQDSKKPGSGFRGQLLSLHDLCLTKPFEKESQELVAQRFSRPNHYKQILARVSSFS